MREITSAVAQLCDARGPTADRDYAVECALVAMELCGVG